MNLTKTTGTTLVVAAALAVAAPAVGGVRPDDRSGVRGGDSATATARLRPDDRPGVRALAMPTNAFVLRRDRGELVSRPEDRAGVRGATGDPIAVAPAHETTTTGRDTFDWTAAAAGAGTATVLLLLVWSLAIRQRALGARTAA